MWWALRGWCDCASAVQCSLPPGIALTLCCAACHCGLASCAHPVIPHTLGATLSASCYPQNPLIDSPTCPCTGHNCHLNPSRSPLTPPHHTPPRPRYSSYCANVARTYFVDPNARQEAEYAALFAAQQAAIAALVEGAPMSAAYEAVVKTLQVGRVGRERWGGLCV